jgi:hypothetical protein
MGEYYSYLAHKRSSVIVPYLMSMNIQAPKIMELQMILKKKNRHFFKIDSKDFDYIFAICGDPHPKQNSIDGIFRKITVSELVA